MDLNHATPLVTEKHYVDFQGLRALIDKIAVLRAEYLDLFKESAIDFNALLDRVNAIIPVGEADDKNFDLAVEGGYAFDGNSILEDVRDYLNGLRAELGASDNAIADKTVYDRIAQLEDEVQTAETGLLDRTSKLEAESFADVEINSQEEQEANNLIKVTFKNAAGDVLKNEDGSDKGFVIDTTDFVVDGMLGDIRLISVVSKGTSVKDMKDGVVYTSATPVPEGETAATGEWATIITESNGYEDEHRYFVFTFKTTEADTETPDFAGEAKISKNIWVPVEDLHDSYEFQKAVADGSADYVTFAVEDTHGAQGASIVTYTVGLSDLAIEGIDLANGKFETVAHADGKNYRGIKTLNANLEEAEGNIEVLEDYVVNGWTDSETNEAGESTEIKRKGLLDRMKNAEENIEVLDDRTAAVEDWIETHTVTREDIWAYFDQVVYGRDDNDVLQGRRDEAKASENNNLTGEPDENGYRALKGSVIEL